MRRWISAVIPSCGVCAIGVLLALAPALWPLFRPGLWAAHDMFHHLFRVVELDLVLRGGVLYARWLPDLGFFYGYPVLNFYAPLTYYLTVLWRWLGLGYGIALKVSYGLSFLGAAWGAYRWARDVWSPWAALWVAIAYTYVPYHLANAYVRGALAEHWAQALAPWLFWWVGRMARGQPRGGWAILGGLGALLVMTHNLSAMVFLPASGVYFLWWLGVSRDGARWSRVRHALAGFLLAVALSAIYWLPALLEVSWIRAGQVASQVVDHVRQLAAGSALLSPYWVYRYYPAQGVPFEHPLGRWQVIMVLLGVAVFFGQWRRWARGQRYWLAIAGVLLMASILLMSRLSAVVWSSVPFLAFLQFPWRLQGLVALMTAAWAAPLAELVHPRKSVADGRRFTVAMSGMLVFLGLWVGTSMPYLPRERLSWPGSEARPVEERDLVFWGMAQYDFLNGLWAREYGDPWLMEYLPVTVQVPREAFWLPASAQEVEDVVYTPPEVVRVVRQCPTAFELEVRATVSTFLRWHQFWFPGWRATVDGEEVTVTPSPRLGLVTFPVPAGEHRIRVWFGETAARRWGRWITLVSLGVLVLGLWRGGRRGVVAVLVGSALVWGALWTWQNARASTCVTPEPAWFVIGERVAYLGCATRRNVTPTPDRVVITPYWLALATVPEDWKSFVHLLDSEGNVLAQNDAYPVENFSPPTRWEVGEIVPDVHTVALPSPEARWERVRLGLYRFSGQVENLPWRGANGENAGTAGVVRCQTP